MYWTNATGMHSRSMSGRRRRQLSGGRHRVGEARSNAGALGASPADALAIRLPSWAWVACLPCWAQFAAGPTAQPTSHQPSTFSAITALVGCPAALIKTPKGLQIRRMNGSGRAGQEVGGQKPCRYARALCTCKPVQSLILSSNLNFQKLTAHQQEIYQQHRAEQAAQPGWKFAVHGSFTEPRPCLQASQTTMPLSCMHSD